MLFVFKGTSEVDPALSKKLTFSLKEMHSLKRFNVFTRSLKYPLVRSLLLGALCNTSTTEVYISDRVVGKCTHKVFNEDDLVNIIYTVSIVSPSSANPT